MNFFYLKNEQEAFLGIFFIGSSNDGKSFKLKEINKEIFSNFILKFTNARNIMMFIEKKMKRKHFYKISSVIVLLSLTP